MPVEAKTAQIKIYNGSDTVRTIDGVPTGLGSSKLSWDLTDNNGNKLPNGNYKFEVEALNNSGDKMSLGLFKIGMLEVFVLQTKEPFLLLAVRNILSLI